MKRKDYRKIVDKLIEKSFPKLKRKKIFVFKFFYLCRNAVAMVADFYIFKSIWVNDKKMSKFSKQGIKAVLAHELAHLDIIANKNLFGKIEFGINLLFTKNGERNFERVVDILVVKKGYGKGLLSVILKIEKMSSKEKNLKRKSRGYLNSEEIKSYIEKYKK